MSEQVSLEPVGPGATHRVQVTERESHRLLCSRHAARGISGAGVVGTLSLGCFSVRVVEHPAQGSL